MDYDDILSAVREAMDHEPTAGPTEAHLKLAILRSEALYNFYAAERRRGLPPLEANESMNEFAKRFDALPQPAEKVA